MAPALLVSVRSIDEAEAALAGGAGLIDVKEPTHGPLGRADDAVVEEIVHFVAGRRPVSAALSELAVDFTLPPAGLTYVKWGLARWQGSTSWQKALEDAMAQLRAAGRECAVVPVAYADWQRAAAPRPEEVCAFACHHGYAAFLIDTFAKDGSGLLDWVSLEQLAQWATACRSAGVRLALAGSLTAALIRCLASIAPDWFAVRGAACTAEDRTGTVESARVERLAALLQSATASTSAS